MQLLRSDVADDRAIELGQACPVDIGQNAVVVFVTAHERDRVSAPRVGHRHAGVGGNTDAEWNARHHLERNSLRVQKQRFLASAIEDEGVAAFEPRHQLPLSRLLGKEKRNRVLLHRLTPGAADVDQLGSLARLFEHSRRDLVIVNHDVGALEAFKPVHGDEARIARAGPDQVNSRSLHE